MPYLPVKKETNVEVSENEIVYEIDLEGNFIFLNRAAEIISGYSCEEARQMNVTQLVAPEFVDYVREQLSSRRPNRLGLVYEIEILSRDGRRVAVETSTRLICREDGSVTVQGIALVKGAREKNSLPTYEIRCLHPEFVFFVTTARGTNLVQNVTRLNPKQTN